MMRRFFALLLATPLLANCSESVTPVASSGAVVALEESPMEEWESPAAGSTILGDWEVPAGEATPDELTVQGAPDSGALMDFGNPTAGTAYFPPGVHDHSYTAKDKVIPGTVVIDAGQKVTFHVYPSHRVAIYKDGVRPEDIQIGTGPFVLDPTNRLALQAVPVPMISFTFHKPGRYLVICALTRHFVDSNMYGWVIVR